MAAGWSGADDLPVAEAVAAAPGRAGAALAGVDEAQVAGGGVGEGVVRRGEPLLSGGAGDGDAGGGVGGLGEAGAVEPAGSLTSPAVGDSELAECVVDGFGRGGAGGGGERGGVGGSGAQDVSDVGVVVVVAVDRGGDAGAVAGAVGAQVACRGVDGVGGVERAGRAGACAVPKSGVSL